MRSTLRVSLIVLCTIGMIVANALATVISPHGEGVGSVSARNPTLITPAGYAFSIWSIIYLGLIAFTIFQALPSQRDNKLLRRIDFWYIASCVFNASWIVVWMHELIVLSVFVMIGLLVSLLVIYVKIDKATEEDRHWIIAQPFRLYTGWITVATVLNVSIFLRAIGWNGQPLAPWIWAIIILAVIVGLGLIVSYPRRDLTYLGVLIWALIAIGVARVGTPTIQIAAWTAAGFLLVGGIFTLLRKAKVEEG